MKINFEKITGEFIEYYLLDYYFKNDYSYYEYLKKNDPQNVYLLRLKDMYEKNSVFLNRTFINFVLSKDANYFDGFFKFLHFDRIEEGLQMGFEEFGELVYLIGDFISSVDALYKDHSCHLGLYLTQMIDYSLYDWKNASDCFFNENYYDFEPDEFDWEKYSLQLVMYGEQFFDKERFNWDDEEALCYLIIYKPYLFDEDYFNWDKYSYLFIKCAFSNKNDELFNKYKHKINYNDPQVIDLMKKI